MQVKAILGAKLQFEADWPAICSLQADPTTQALDICPRARASAAHLWAAAL